MNYIFLLLLILFIIFGIMFAISPLVSMLSIYQKKKQTKEHNNIQKNLENLEKPLSVEQKAKAFVTLIKLSYVSIHILGNQGGKYNDKKQMKRFKQSLTPQAVEKIKMLGEQ